MIVGRLKTVGAVNMVGTVDDSQLFSGMLMNNKAPILLFFFMPNCPHCKKMMPAVEELGATGKIMVLKCDIYSCPQAAKHFQVQSAPTSFLMKDGKVHDRMDGALEREQLYGRIQPFMVN